ncbi:hypothetical protein IZY60_14555 [Lutibacter sp. B2]|nr:hypothetical protein [Lutibacter sp. B2]
MNCIRISKKKVFLYSIIFILLLVGVVQKTIYRYPLGIIGNGNIPNLCIEVKNKSVQSITISMTYDEKVKIKRTIEGGEKETINLAYRSNLGDRLNIQVINKNKKVITELNPYLSKEPQHIYNPNIKYKAEIIFEKGVLNFKQTK